MIIIQIYLKIIVAFLICLSQRVVKNMVVIFQNNTENKYFRKIIHSFRELIIFCNVIPIIIQTYMYGGVK